MGPFLLSTKVTRTLGCSKIHACHNRHFSFPPVNAYCRKPDYNICELCVLKPIYALGSGARQNSMRDLTFFLTSPFPAVILRHFRLGPARPGPPGLFQIAGQFRGTRAADGYIDWSN